MFIDVDKANTTSSTSEGPLSGSSALGVFDKEETDLANNIGIGESPGAHAINPKTYFPSLWL